MSDHSQHITHYTAADIQRYLSGGMTASEMHALEKAALEDPFLADAIEGMETAMQVHGEAPVNTNLEELRAAIAERIKPAGRRRAMTWWRFAAAAVVLVAAGFFVWNSFMKSENSTVNQVATFQKETKADTAARLQPVVTDEGYPAEFQTADTDALADNSKKSKSRIIPENRSLDKELSDSRASYNYSPNNNTPDPQANRLLAVKPQPPVLADGKAISLDTNVPAKVAPAPANQLDLAKKADNMRSQWDLSDTSHTEVVGVLQGKVQGLNIVQSNTKLSNVIRGRVTDNFARPIPNANLNLQTNQRDLTMGESYFTDREGYFNIPNKQYDTSALNISVAAAGYNTQQFQLNRNVAANQLNTLQLQPLNQSLNEVVVTGYGARKKTVSGKARDIDLLQQNAEPVYGWVGYEKYLRENNRLRNDSSNIQGEAVVTFIVNRSGILSDFNVTGSLPQPALQEAARLVREGPSWKIKRGRKATTTVIVRF